MTVKEEELYEVKEEEIKMKVEGRAERQWEFFTSQNFPPITKVPL